MRSMPNTCHLNCTPFWSTVRHKKQAMYEKQKREQMREQENIERHQPLVLNGVTLKLQSVPIKIKPSDKPVTIPKVPVFHCDACLGNWQLTCSLQEVTRQLLVMKVLNLFLDHAIIHAYVYLWFWNCQVVQCPMQIAFCLVRIHRSYHIVANIIA